MRRTLGSILLGLWAVAASSYGLWQEAIREPFDCCAPSGMVVGVDVFLVALITLPVAFLGLWLVNEDRDQTPKLALGFIGVFLLIVPVVVGVAVEVL